MAIEPATPTGGRIAPPILSFRGAHRFLSNFVEVPGGVRYRTIHGPTIEHAFQAAKTLDPVEQHSVLSATTPLEARKRGRRVTLRPDWDAMKLGVMAVLVRSKFDNPALGQQLMSTGDALLVEGNHWCDTYWGACTCPKHAGQLESAGANWLGHILMINRSVMAA